jgi:CMP-N-acetylneuraminic acid synthetase
VVSSEDEEILSVVAAMGCEVIKRKKELATDTARVVDVIRDLLTQPDDLRKTYKYLCCLYAAAPLRTHEDIIGSYQLMIDTNSLFCQSVTGYDHDPCAAFEMDLDGSLKRNWPELALLPRWDRPDLVKDNGSIYWADVDAFLKSGEFHGDRLVGYKMPRWRSVDIDTPTDLELALFFAGKIESGNFKTE